jgi:hypothetical protein
MDWLRLQKRRLIDTDGGRVLIPCSWFITRNVLRVLCVALAVQAMDYTVIKAVCTELSTKWTPAKIERIVQADRFTLLICIRTLEDSGWLRLCWNPACAHVSVGNAPGGVPSIAEAFSFGEQLRYLLKGLAIIEVCELELSFWMAFFLSCSFTFWADESCVYIMPIRAVAVGENSRRLGEGD